MTNNIKFCTYYDQWVDTYKAGQVRPVTLAKYYSIGRQLHELVPNLKLSVMTRFDVQTLVNKYGKTHELSTVREFLHHIKAPLQDAVYEGWLTKDPTYKVHPTSQFKRPTTRVKWLEMDQVKRLETAFNNSNSVAARMFDFDLRTSLRLAELLGLTPGDIDENNLTVSVNKTWKYKDKHPDFGPTKNKFSVRIIKIDHFALDDLERVIAMCKPKTTEPIFIKGFSKETKQNQHIYTRILHHQKYCRVFDATLSDRLNAFCKEANVPRISIHSLRHTHASILITNHVSIQSVAKRLGHTNTETTQSTYIHLLDDLAAQDDDKMLSVLSKLTS